jgi:glycosyltransferase involved in cell wall biosynthesis
MERLLLITPCRDEADHLERTLASVAAQTRPPDLWLIVDDGSTDATPEILSRWAARLPYLEPLRARPRPAGGDGLAEAAEAVAFNQALRSVAIEGFSHVGKLDADIELSPDYFQRLLDRSSVEVDLGIVGGSLLEDHGSGWRPTGGPEHHVRGALKLYRRDCLEALGGGIEERLGWDTIDEVGARMLGYQTRSLSQPTARHLRPVASRGGILPGRARLGRAAFILRYSPWWVVAKSAQVGLKRPWALGGIAYFWGYLRAAAGDRHNRVEDPEFARFVAAELRGRARGRGIAKVSSGARRS